MHKKHKKGLRILVTTIGDKNWMGGINYLVSLIYSAKLADPNSQFVHLGSVNTSLYGKDAIFDEVITEIAPTSFLKKLFRKINRLVFSKLPFKSGLADLSFAFPYKNIPELAWIADFQHKHHPEFFSSEDIKARDRAFSEKVNKCKVIMVSSENAKKDCLQFYPESANKVEVYRFSPKMDFFPTPQFITETQNKYNAPKHYFFLPNQFWVHKNHRVVFQAVKILKNQNINVHVVLTGRQFDYRWPNHFNELMTEIKNDGLENQLLFLELIPFHDMIALMVGADATINPSKFEGWSTTVEEAKALKTPLILSNIEVHKEQCATYPAHLFSPNNPEELSLIMKKLVATRNLESYDTNQLQQNHRDHCKLTGERFLQICRKLVS